MTTDPPFGVLVGKKKKKKKSDYGGEDFLRVHHHGLHVTWVKKERKKEGTPTGLLSKLV